MAERGNLKLENLKRLRIIRSQICANIIKRKNNERDEELAI
jgi:hypothetical protein